LECFLVISMVGAVRATITVYEAGYRLCDFFCNPRTEYGTGATIIIPNQTTLPGDSVSFWTGLDEYPTGAGIPSGTHWWAQAGYIIGTRDGVTYAQPEMYIETNGNSYSFQTAGQANWNTYHTFQIWISPTTGAANFIMDGNQIAVVSMPSNFNSGGSVTNFLEVHRSGGSFDQSTGSWSNLEYYECWIVGQSCWNSWNCSNCGAAAVSTYPYYVDSHSLTSFGVWTNVGGSIGGSGCGGCKLV
jgi:hypothetical protein